MFVGGAFRPAAEAVVSVFDHGLLYGDGIFEGIRAYSGLVFKLDTDCNQTPFFTFPAYPWLSGGIPLGGVDP